MSPSMRILHFAKLREKVSKHELGWAGGEGGVGGGWWWGTCEEPSHASLGRVSTLAANKSPEDEVKIRKHGFYPPKNEVLARFEWCDLLYWMSLEITSSRSQLLCRKWVWLGSWSLVSSGSREFEFRIIVWSCWAFNFINELKLKSIEGRPQNGNKTSGRPRYHNSYLLEVHQPRWCCWLSFPS